MNTKKIENYVNAFGLPVLTVVAGLVLLLNPDGAAALVTKLVGWILVIAGAARLIGPALKHQQIPTSTWFGSGGAILAGVVLLARPMILADSIGRLFGILLLIEGFRNLRESGVRLLTVLTIAAGVVLFIMPRTLTQTLLSICGIVLIVIGVINFLGRLNQTKRLQENRDPNIIDADM